MKPWRNLLIAVITFVLCWIGLDFYLSQEIKTGYNYAVNDDASDIRKEQGVILQQTSLDKGDILLLGSSELGSPVDQNASNFFPTKECPYMINAVGRAEVLSMEHALNVESLDFSQNKKVVCLVSYAWFAKDSVAPDAFYANFSKNKFYRYMTDWGISDKEKIQTASRISSLVRSYNNTDDVEAWGYAELCKKFPFAYRVIETAAFPLLMFERAVLSTKDKAASFLYLRGLVPYDMKKPEATDWEKEYEKADAQGKKMVTNNGFYFEDSYQNDMADILPGLKNADVSLNLQTSQEFKDYDLFLKTCCRKHIKPLIIVESVNGWYYDYRGLDREKRLSLYKRLRDMAENYGFTVYDMSDMEYTPYTYYDQWHLGWRGWLYVDQKITEYFGSNS